MRTLTMLRVSSALVASATAATAAVRAWLALSGSWSTYSMADAGDDTGEINALPSGSGRHMDHINRAFVFGVDGGVEGDRGGTGLLVEPCAGADWWTALQLAIPGSLGQLYAKVNEATAGGDVMHRADGSRYTMTAMA